MTATARYLRVVVPSLLLALSVACGGARPDSGGSESAAATRETAGSAGRLRVYTVNYPLAYFAERIAGDHAEVVFPDALAQGDPAYAQPGAETIAAFQGADLIVRNGAGYAAWVDRVTLPASRIVDTASGFADRIIRVEGTTTHSHGPEGEHSHSETAFTTWLDFTLAVEQAEAIVRALATARPEAAADFEANARELRGDLETLDARLSKAAAAVADTSLLASHPVYQYLARRYQLLLESVHFEPDTMPDESAWQELRALLADQPAAWMFWEAPPIPEIVDRLTSMGIGVVVFDPCATPPEQSDFLTVMRDNVARFEELAGRPES